MLIFIIPIVRTMIDATDLKSLLIPITEEAFALLGEETRRKIIFLLRDNELTVKEMASELGLTTQNIYHHIEKLQEVGLVRVVAEKRKGHLLERYYTVTADTFIYREDRMEENDYQSSFDILNRLNELGIGIDVIEENAEKLSELNKTSISLLSATSVEHRICTYCSYSGYFMKFGPMNPMLLRRILIYANLIGMSNEEFESYLEIVKDLRGFLCSIKLP